MQTDSDKLRNILKLTELLAQDYLSSNKSRNINNLKEKIKDFLTNELWDNEKLFRLKKEVNEIDFNDEETEKLWKKMEEIFDMSYAQHLKNKTHIFEGKVRVYEKRIIEILVEAGKIKGQNSVFGSIIGYLLLHSSLTQSQLKELTGFSKGAISQTLKILSKTPAIKKELIKGGREYSYSLGANMDAIASNIGSYKSENNELAIKFLKKKLQELNNHNDKNGYDTLSSRVSEMINFFEYNIKMLEKINQSSFIKDLKEDNI